MYTNDGDATKARMYERLISKHIAASLQSCEISDSLSHPEQLLATFAGRTDDDHHLSLEMRACGDASVSGELLIEASPGTGLRRVTLEAPAESIRRIFDLVSIGAEVKISLERGEGVWDEGNAYFIAPITAVRYSAAVERENCGL